MDNSISKAWKNDVRESPFYNNFNETGFNSDPVEWNEKDEIILSELKDQWNYLHILTNVNVEDFANVNHNTVLSVTILHTAQCLRYRQNNRLKSRL